MNLFQGIVDLVSELLLLTTCKSMTTTRDPGLQQNGTLQSPCIQYLTMAGDACKLVLHFPICVCVDIV